MEEVLLLLLVAVAYPLWIPVGEGGSDTRVIPGMTHDRGSNTVTATGNSAATTSTTSTATSTILLLLLLLRLCEN